MLILPEFRLLNRQPKIPHVAYIIMQRDVPNEYGASITYTVRRSRNGKDWWISASREGMRMSDTLHTGMRAKSDVWISAVETGRVRVGEPKTKAQLDEIDEIIAWNAKRRLEAEIREVVETDVARRDQGRGIR